jgi:diguanylate cyclase (GGDEF)-like protein
VEAELARSPSPARFAPGLEAVFERDTGPARSKHLVRAGILSLILYNSFLLSDARLIPDVFGLAMALRWVCSAIYIAVLIHCATNPPARLREALQGICLTVVLLASVALLALSHAPGRQFLCITFVLFVVYANVVLRLRRAWCLIFTVAATLAATAAMLQCAECEPGVRELTVLSLLATVAFTLYANVTIESAERRSFLLGLKQRLSGEELALANARLSALSTTDWLTGIANRRGLEKLLREAWAEAARAEQPLALLMIDVDHFKLFNDLHGHPAGDACLRQLAALIATQLRTETDRIGRYGGEEFAVILPNTLESDAARAAERIRQSVEDMAIVHGDKRAGPVITVSIGARAAYPAKGGAPEQLIAAADHALYASKQGGRNRVQPPPLGGEFVKSAANHCS